MTDLARLQSAIEPAEGFGASAYRDSKNLWTIGFGACLETAPLTGAEWKALLDQGAITVTITKDGARWLEAQRIQFVIDRLAHDYEDFWSSLNDARQNSMVEMAYQMGITKEEAFHDMLAAIRRGDFTGAKIAGMDSIWYREFTSRAERVLEQLRTGEFP
jgi:lysozyme